MEMRFICAVRLMYVCAMNFDVIYAIVYCGRYDYVLRGTPISIRIRISKNKGNESLKRVDVTGNERVQRSMGIQSN
jgi:hypothetical protein